MDTSKFVTTMVFNNGEYENQYTFPVSLLDAYDMAQEFASYAPYYNVTITVTEI